jgi:hypothetical protein
VGHGFARLRAGDEPAVAVNAALVETLLTGVPLPASRDELAAYAREQDADAGVLWALEHLREDEYGSLNDVGDELRGVRTSPPTPALVEPRAESGEPPGGDKYIA